MTEEKKPWEKYAEQSSEVKPWEKYSSNQEAEPLKKKDQQQYAGVNQKPSEEESGVSSPEPAPVAEKKSGSKEEGNWFTDGLKNSFPVAPVVDLISKFSEKAKTYQQEKINKAAKSISSEELAKANPTDIYLNSAAQSGENYSQITKDGKIRPAFDYSTIDDQVDVNDYHKWISNIKKGLEAGEAPAPSPMDDLYKQILSQDNEETLGFANKAYLHNQQVIGIKYDNLTKSDENKAVIARAASLKEGIKSLGSRNDDDASNQRQQMVDEFSQLSSQYGDVLSEYDNLVAADEKSRKYIQNAYKLNKNGFDAIDRKIESSKSLDKNFDGWNKAGIAIPHAALKLVTSIARIPSTVANTAMGIAGNEDYTWADQWDESLDKIADIAIDEYAPKSINPLGKYIPVDNVSYESSKDINKGLADFDEDGKFSGINTANLGWNLTNTMVDMGILLGGGVGIGSGLKSLGAGAKLANSAGLMTSSYLITTPEYYKAAKEAGVPHAKLFAAAAGVLTSSLELMNPNVGIAKSFSKEGAEMYAKTIAKSLASGSTAKQSLKDGMKYLVKENIGENLQEFSQMLGDKAIEGVANYVGNENYFDHNIEQLKGEAIETALLTTLATGLMSSVNTYKTSKAVLPYDEAINMVAKDSDKYMPIVQSMIKNQEIDPESTKRIMEDVNNRKSVIEQYGEETAYIDRVTGNPMTKDQAEQAIIDAPNSVEVFNDEETKILQEEKIAELPRGWKVKSIKQTSPKATEPQSTEQAPVDPKIRANETIRYVREHGIGSEVTEDQIKLLLKDRRAKNNQIGRVTQNITKVMSKLSSEAPRMVILNSVEDANALAKKLYNKDGVDVNGWIDREANTMFFVPNATTAIHEVVMHPVIDAVKKYKPELYQQFLEDVGNIKGSDGKTFLERSKDLGYKGDKIGEEAIVDFLSQVAGDNFKGGRISVIGAQIADAFRKILSAIGLTDKDLRINLDNPVTLQNFAAQLADAIDKGKTIDFGFDNKVNKKETDFSVVGNEPISNQPSQEEDLQGLVTGDSTKEKLKAQGLTEVANNLPSNFKEPDFSFVGLKASKRLGDASLKEARQMEASGSKPNDIWLKTGWERAADGHWISEIFDPKTARVNKKSLTEKVKLYKNPTYKLPEVLNHPKLFKAYPELRNIDVKLMRLKDGHFGTYHSGQNRIDFDPTKNVDAEKLTGFLLHEVQHTIQEIETQSSGAQGGTSSYWTNIGETVARNVENRLGLSQAERVATPPSSTEDIKRGDQTTSADMVNKIIKGFNTMISNGDLTAIDALTILKAAKYNTNHQFYAPLRKMAKDEARSLALRVKDDSVSFSQQTETTRRVVEPDTTINQALRSELLNNPNDPKFTYNEQKIKATLDAWKNMSAADIANDMSRFKPSDLLAFLRDVDGTNNLSALGFIEIFKKATAEGNDNLAFDAFEALNKIGSGAGQLLRQMRELSSAVMSPNAPRAQRIGANRGIVKIIVAKFFEKNNFVLTAEMKVEIDNLINNYVTAMANEQDAHKKYTASGLKADEARWRDATKQTNDALASMEDFMSNNVPQDLGDLISTLIKGNLLTASSVVVNTTSNLTNAALTGLVEGQAVPIVRGATRRITGAKGSGFVGSSVAAAYAAHTFAKNIGPAFREAFKRGGMRPRDMNKFEVMRHIHPYQALTQLFRSAVNKASGKDVYKTGTLPKKWDATSSPLSAKAYTPVSVVVGKTAEGLFGWPAALMFRLLHATDKPFKEAARIFAATQALSAEKNGAKPTIEEVMNYIDNATPEQAEKIDGYADQFAYSDPNSIAAKAGNRFVGLPSYIAEMLDKQNLGGVGRATSSFLKLLGTSVQPYVTVPSNVMSHFIELVMPPVAVAGAVKNYRNGNREQGDQMIGRAIVGSTFYMAAGTLYTLGLVMAGDDDDKTGDKALKNMLGGSKSLNMSGLIRLSTGGDPSFKQGDKTVALSKLGIFGLFTDFQARWAEEMKDKGVWNDNYWDTMISQHWGEALGAYYPAFFKSSLDLSFFTGQLELFDSIKASGRDDGNGWNRFTTGLFDTASNLVWANQYSQIAQGIAAENGDRPNMLRAQSDSWTGLMYEKFGKKMPWIDAESDLAPVLDLWGKPVKNSFLEINDPFKIRTVSDETSMDIWKLMTKTGAGNPVSIPTKNISLDGTTYSLDEADYLSLQAISGEFRKSYINEIMNTEEYRIANDAEKIQMIKEISKEANNDAKSAFEDQWAEQVNNGNIVIENGQYRYVKTGRVGKAR